MISRGKQYDSRLQQFIEEVTIYPVSCERLAAGRTDEQWLDEVLRGGARIVQLRDKDSSDRRLLEKAKYFRRKTSEAGALFLVNDRFDIALLADADGIHLGQGDVPPEEVLKLAPEMIIGISCNSEDQAKSLGENEKRGKTAISYYNIGPLYPTKTKEGLSNFIGPESVVSFSSHITLPFTVMGGIKRQHINELVRLGARRLAVVTALTAATNIADETARWIKEMRIARSTFDG